MSFRIVIVKPHLKHSKVFLQWDIEEYHIQHVKNKRDKKRVKFPNPQFGAFSDPLTVVDLKGRIILWYLPGLLSVQKQVGFFLPVHSKISNLFKIGRRPTRDCSDLALAKEVGQKKGSQEARPELANTSKEFCQEKHP